MKARSVVVGVASAGAMVFASAMGASANISWCLEDPPVQVQTASGSNLTVNTAVSVPQYQAKYIGDVAIDAVTQSDGSGGTLITLYVSVPTSITVAKITATVKKYKVVTESTTIAGGGSAVLRLDVPAA